MPTPETLAKTEHQADDRAHGEMLERARLLCQPRIELDGAGLPGCGLENTERYGDHRGSSPPTATYFSSSHSSSPYFDPSRPMPDSFMPPNGATSVETNPVLMPTMP